jgi:hypothetical protein
MNYAIELYFDKASTAAIDKLRIALEKNGVTTDTGTIPHVSLAIYDDPDEDSIINSTICYMKRNIDLSLDFTSIGIFPGLESVVFLAPKVTERLLAVHNEFLHFMKPYSPNLLNYYDANNWTPHCTLGIHLSQEQLGVAVGTLNGIIDLPIHASVERIGVLAYPPNRQIYTGIFENL